MMRMMRTCLVDHFNRDSPKSFNALELIVNNIALRL
jgi:hypothetical protein